jgi:hypothetical protein
MKLFFAFLLTAILPTGALAWAGPICFPDSTHQVVMTLDEVQGAPIDNAADIQVFYEDNDGEVELAAIQPSSRGGFEFVFSHTEGTPGIVGIRLFNTRGMFYWYELEFRDGACSGARISAN